MRYSYSLKLIAFFAVYFFTGLIGLKIDAISQMATLIWPPSGLSVATLLILGYRMWPGVMVGAFAVNILATGSPVIATGVCVGNTLEALVAAYLLRRLTKFQTSLERSSDVLAFIGIAALFSTLISAVVGVTSGWLGGIVESKNVLHTFLVWWFGDASGDLVIAPALLTWFSKSPSRVRRTLFENAFFLISLLGLGWLVFISDEMALIGVALRPYLLFPLLIWTCLRFEQRWISSTVLLIAVFAIYGAFFGKSPFQEATLTLTLFHAQMFMWVVSSTSLILGAVVSEKRRKEEELHAHKATLEDTVAKRTQKLRENEEKLEESQKVAHLGHWEYDPVQNKVQWSNEVFRIFGIPPQELTYETFRERNHPDDRARIDGMVEEAGRTGKPQSFVHRILRPSGEIRVLRGQINVTRNEQGQPIYYFGTTQDITEQKALEDAKLRAEEQFRLTIESINEYAIYLLDPGGKITSWNEGGRRIKGYEASEAIGQNVAICYLEEDRKAGLPRWILREAEAAGKMLEEAWHVRKDGSRFWASSVTTALKDNHGTLRGFLRVTRDMTARKEAEQELERLLAKVESGYKEIEKANRAKDLFLAILSHELRTPLTSTYTWTELLKKKNDPVILQHGLNKIQEGIKQQEQMISDLLDVSRIVSGKIAIKKEVTHVVTVLTAVMEAFGISAKEKGIQILSQHDVGYADILADPARLKQIFGNILANAIKFTPSGGTITVSIHCEKSNVIIQFRDTGKGIKREFLPNIFDLFSQQDTSSVRAYGGLGLGLSIVKNLIELQSGTVKAESEGEGKGSTFTLSFPLSSATVIDSRKHKARGESLDESARDLTQALKNMKILVVEDDRNALEALQLILQGYGADVRGAASVAEALSVMDQFKPGIILSDIAMPGEDGYSLIRKIRRMPKEKGGETLTIALTAYAGQEDRKRALSFGFNEHVAKPVDSRDLVAIILKVAA